MKKIFLFLFLLAFSISAFSQGGTTVLSQQNGAVKNSMVAGATTAPAASAIIEGRSTTKGFLAPRLTTVQRDAIGSPATGLMVYNTTTNAFNYYNGSQWQVIDTGLTLMSNGLTLSGNTGKLGGALTENTSVTFDPSTRSILFGDVGSSYLLFGAPVGSAQRLNCENSITQLKSFDDGADTYCLLQAEGTLTNPTGPGAKVTRTDDETFEVGFAAIESYTDATRFANIYYYDIVNGTDLMNVTVLYDTVNPAASYVDAMQFQYFDDLNAKNGWRINNGSVFLYTASTTPGSNGEFFKMDTLGDITASAYPGTRDDTAEFSPVNFIYTDNTGNVLSAPLGALGTGFIPLAGTQTGYPVTGDIQIDALTDGEKTIYSGSLGGNYKKLFFDDDGDSFGLTRSSSGTLTNLSLGSDGIGIFGNDAGFKGISGAADYSANITDLDFTQKIYVDAVAPTISSGTVAPASTPAKVGDLYIDTVAKKLYFATGTASSADWTIAN